MATTRLLFAICLAVVHLACGAQATRWWKATRDASKLPYKDASLSPEARVQDLISRMTIQDKVAQLLQGDISNWIDTTTNAFNYSGLVNNMATKAGSFYVGYPVPQRWIADGVARGQQYLASNTTLAIPAFVQSEGIHGFLVGNATIFNSPIGFACSFNTELVQRMAGVIAQEARALGVNQLFAPVVDLARELRYGRVEETFGEDPYLAGEMGFAYVKGLQAGNVSAMVKHFAGFSAPEQGLNTGPVHGGDRELRTTWLPPFHRAIMGAGAFSIMSAYHSYDGIPAVADRRTLTDILRGEWGYKYFVMSDAGATDRLCGSFNMCRAKPIDKEAVTMYALPAGTDVEMGGGSFNYMSIPGLVESGKLNSTVVDGAVSRFLLAKFTLGLFDTPVPDMSSNETAAANHTAKSIALARELDGESIVLLENHNSLLPLKRSSNIAVIGPMAHGFMNYGDYVVYKSQYRGVTPLDGIQAASTGKVTYAKGCERWSNDETGFAEAVSAAATADAAVVVVGTWSRDQNELWQGLNATTGEHVDLSSLNLVGAQANLVRTVINAGKPTIVVFSSGKPITEPWISREAGALIQQFYPSEEGGNALADILYGTVNPSGKLSVGFPYDVGTAPIFYDYLNSGRGPNPDAGSIGANGPLHFGHQYVLNTPKPLYPFGYGLSYSQFLYSNVTLSSSTASANDTLTVTVNVSNESDIDGKEVVQLYSQDLISSVVVPNIQLKGFTKVLIPARQTVTVSIPLNVQDLGLWDINMKYVVEPGEFQLWIGSSSQNLTQKALLTVINHNGLSDNRKV